MRKSEYPKEDKTLGQKIRKKRMDLGKPLKEIADKADITESYLSRIEADQKVPSAEVAGEIAKALNVAPEEYYPFLISNSLSTTFAQSSFDKNSSLNLDELIRLYKRKKS
jgi:transcriptional regulator with XRE-family HTH domain